MPKQSHRTAVGFGGANVEFEMGMTGLNILFAYSGPCLDLGSKSQFLNRVRP